jgi:hypothetical protein
MRYNGKISKDAIRKFPQSSLELFSTFSRFEFALKEWGYIITSKDQNLTSDWKQFAESLPSEFAKRILSNAIAPTLIAQPPRVQIKKCESSVGYESIIPTWGPKPSPLDLSGSAWPLFKSIKTVRNNLFHGGKSFERESNSTEREIKLVEESVACLYEALHWHNDVRLSFEGNY